jgi:hypothetical protein
VERVPGDGERAGGKVERRARESRSLAGAWSTEAALSGGLIVVDAPGKGRIDRRGMSRATIMTGAGYAAGQRAGDGYWAAVDEVGVDHRRAHILVAQQHLDGADVRACFEPVCGEAVAQRVAGGALIEPGGKRLRGTGAGWSRARGGALGSRGCVRALGSADGWLAAAGVGLGSGRRPNEMLGRRDPNEQSGSRAKSGLWVLKCSCWSRHQ